MPLQTLKVGEKTREPEDWGGKWILAFIGASEGENVEATSSLSFSLPPDGQSMGETQPQL